MVLKNGLSRMQGDLHVRFLGGTAQKCAAATQQPAPATTFVITQCSAIGGRPCHFLRATPAASPHRASARRAASSAWHSRPRAPLARLASEVHVAVFGLPIAKRCLRYPVLTRQVGRLGHSLVLLQHRDNLLFRRRARFIRPSSVRSDSNSFWRKFLGAGHRASPAAWQELQEIADASSWRVESQCLFCTSASSGFIIFSPSDVSRSIDLNSRVWCWKFISCRTTQLTLVHL
jgi:hypothetical protein